MFTNMFRLPCCSKPREFFIDRSKDFKTEKDNCKNKDMLLLLCLKVLELKSVPGISNL